MTALSICPDVEQSFPLDHSKLAAQGELTAIGLLRHGTTSGWARRWFDRLAGDQS